MLAHITIIHTVKEVEQRKLSEMFYPNPANNIVHIQTQKIMEYHIIEQMELIDPLGRVVDKWTSIPTKFLVWHKQIQWRNVLLESQDKH